jgi:hypothetical protein
MKTILSEAIGGTAAQPRLVYPESWQGEDFFFLSEPGRPVITQRVVGVLDDLGNLDTRRVEDPERIRNLMPLYAAELEKRNWRIERCIRLGPADWVAEARTPGA